MTTQELAEHLNIPPRNIRFLEESGVLKKEGHNRWDPIKTSAAYIRWLQENNGVTKINEYRERHMKAKMEMAEMESELIAGRLVDYEESISPALDEVIQIRTTLITLLPRALSLMAIPKTTREKEIVFRNVVRRQLESVSNNHDKKPGKGNEKKTAKSIRTSARAASKRVGGPVPV